MGIDRRAKWRDLPTGTAGDELPGAESSDMPP